MKSVFVIVPSLSPTGPIKGAIALCNGLSKKYAVTLVNLKYGTGSFALLHPKVRTVSLSQTPRWIEKRKKLIRIFRNESKDRRVVSISFCFSADVFNASMKNYATIISSVRGNLPINYRIEHGPPGVIAALVHFFILRSFDNVVAMSNQMGNQLRSFGLKRITLIGNFLDESTLESYRRKIDRVDDKIRFLFLGRLSHIKRPELPINAMSSLCNLQLNCHLDIIGDGPLKQILLKEVKKYNIGDRVTFHGYLPEPFEILQSADYLVIPSQSEGVSRAVLEALFLGIPCILRDIDTNKIIITPGINGFIFRKDKDFIGVLKAAAIAKQNGTAPRGGNLLPKFFRQDVNIKKFEVLINR